MTSSVSPPKMRKAEGKMPMKDIQRCAFLQAAINEIDNGGLDSLKGYYKRNEGTIELSFFHTGFGDSEAEGESVMSGVIMDASIAVELVEQLRQRFTDEIRSLGAEPI